MLLSSLNTGSTDLRDTEVQQPNTTATLSFCSSSRAFSANNGQLEAGSTTTASSFLPSRPPLLFCSSTSMSTVSFSVVSLMAMVPESECSTPTLMVSSAACADEPQSRAAAAASAGRQRLIVFFSMFRDPLYELELHLQADAELLRARNVAVKVLIDIERADARVELL